MKKLALSALLALSVSVGSLALTSTATASSRQAFTSTMSAQSAPVKVNVIIGEDLTYRADHLSTKLRDRSNARHLRDGFAGKGFYGQRDLDKLASRLKRRMEFQLEKNGMQVSDDAGTVLNLVITNAEPNRPTFKQLSNSVSLSSRSFGIGGAAFEGTLTRAGQMQGDVSYAWFENDIRDAQYGGIWTDANRAIDRFARKTAKSLR